jgi:prepilin-type N-terminal cleavage/methylation domain-containing protein
MSTSSARSWGLFGRLRPGFTVVELMVGLAIGVLIALAVAPLWVSVEKVGAAEADAGISYLQGRVAVARFERDLRLAGAAGSLFATTWAVLEATPTQVVLLERGPEGEPPSLVEWELAGGSLMRRVGACPAVRPGTFAHSLYADNKTMLEHVERSSRLEYLAGAELLAGPVPQADLGLIDTVKLTLKTKPVSPAGVVAIDISTWVGK